MRRTALTSHYMFKHQQSTRLGLRSQTYTQNNNKITITMHSTVISRYLHQARRIGNLCFSYHHHFISGPDVHSFKYEIFFSLSKSKQACHLLKFFPEIHKANTHCSSVQQQEQENLSECFQGFHGQHLFRDFLTTVMTRPGYPVQSHP